MNKKNKYWYERLNENYRREQLKRESRVFVKIAIICISIIVFILIIS